MSLTILILTALVELLIVLTMGGLTFGDEKPEPVKTKAEIQEDLFWSLMFNKGKL